nr:DUF892 family protein [Qipengyuania seohaensis]
MAKKIDDKELAQLFADSLEGIEEHTSVLEEIIEGCDGSLDTKEHCKGMEGLVKEARKHAIDADIESDVRAVAAIAQYQRMSHYGIAGFGTAKAFAQALGRDDDTAKLDEIVDDIYGADDFASELAERSINLAAKQDN